jgi:hypothetical protein
MVNVNDAILSLYQATQGVYQQQVYSTVAREFTPDSMLTPPPMEFKPDLILKSPPMEFKPSTIFAVEYQYNK